MAASPVPLQWVERLLEPSASETMMIQAAQVLSRNHYTDVVEERCISSLCGYPMCSNPLGEQPKQKYHISLSQKKVFDLTERKKFCSAMCYRASKYYASQLSSLPLAARDRKSVVIQLMPYVLASATDRHTDATRELASVETPILSQGTVGLINLKEKDVTVQESFTMSEAASKMMDLEIEDGEDAHDISLNPPKLSSVGRLLHAMSSWCTPDTWQLLASLRLTAQESRLQFDNTTARTEDSVKCDSTRQGSRTQEAAPPRETGSEARTSGGVKDNGGRKSVVLPLVHSSAKSQLQMGIFLQQLKRSFASVTTQLSLNHHEVSPRIMELVRTFSFSRYTVTFKPAEWKVIIFVLLYIVDPEWGLKTVHSASVCEWMKKISATDGDLLLMLDAFKLPDHVQQSQ